MGSTASTTSLTSFTSTTQHQETDKAALIVNGYYRLYIDPYQRVPIDILNLCIEFFRYIIFDAWGYPYKEGDYICIEHCKKNDRLENFIWLKTVKSLFNSSLNYIIDPNGTINDFIWWRIFPSNNGCSNQYTHIRLQARTREYLTICKNKKDQLCVMTEYENDDNKAMNATECSFIIHPDYSLKGIKLESAKYRNKFLRVTNGKKVTISSFNNQYPHQYLFNIFSGYKKLKWSTKRKCVVLIKSANNTNQRNKYLRVDPSNLNYIDSNGDKSYFSLWGFYAMELSENWCALISVASKRVLTVNVDTFSLTATAKTINANCKFNVTVSDNDSVILEARNMKGKYIAINSSTGNVYMDKYGPMCKLKLFRLNNRAGNV